MHYKLATRFGRNAHQISGREPLDNEALYRHVPSIFAQEAHDSRSERYVYVMVGDWPVYPPPAFFWWWFSFDAYAPGIFERGAYIAVSGGFVSIAVAIAMSVWRARELKNAETFGSARWASEKEIRKAGLLGDDGVVLGQFGRSYLRHDGPEHVLCYVVHREGPKTSVEIRKQFS